MKINVKKLGVELRSILDKDGLSVTELAGITGIAPETLYSILDGTRASTQRATIRKIAEATNRDFHISGDRVTFTKKAESGKGMPEDLQELLRMYDKMDPDGRRQLLKIARALWSEDGVLTEMESKKGSN